MQLRGSRRWLGDLLDPESIQASLPDPARPYIDTHPSPPRQTAWGVQGSLLSADVSSSKGIGLEFDRRAGPSTGSPNASQKT